MAKKTKKERRPRIWLIEDHAPDVFLIERSLEMAGIESDLTRYQDGEQVLTALQMAGIEPGVAPDLIVLDLNLPKVSGLEVLRVARQNPSLQKMRVVVLTSSHAPKDRVEASELGADCFITKPIELHTYIAAVGSAVRDLLGTDDADAAGAAG